MAKFIAAVVQNAPVVFDANATLTKIQDLTADAAKLGATLVLFPEAFVSAYPKGLDFGARLIPVGAVSGSSMNVAHIRSWCPGH